MEKIKRYSHPWEYVVWDDYLNNDLFEYAKSQCDIIENNSLVSRREDYSFRKFITNLDDPLAQHFNKFKNSNVRLRIELCCDNENYYQEPHCDIKEKRSTFILFLESESADVGTDIFDGHEFYKSLEFIPNRALIFTPSTNTFHGFRKRKFKGYRKLLIVNYVISEWKDKEQLVEGYI